MNQRPTLVRIAQPCTESWAAMLPTATGRHCTACQKTVVDFTQKTDAEILAALRQTAGQPCGRLRSDQLGRPLVAPAPGPRWRAWLGAALALGGVLRAGRAAAQARNNYYAGPQPVASPNFVAAEAGRASTAAASAKEVPSPPPLVRGMVQDSVTHQGLPGVTVLLKGTNQGVSTDVNGEFSLPLAAAGPVHLIFSYVGYTNEERTVVASAQPLTILLTADTHVLGEMGIVVVGGLKYKRPWPWHPRRFFNWSKYWLTRSFQQ